MDERAEAGLVSHNIEITGPDSARTLLGGQVMIMAGGTLSKFWISNPMNTFIDNSAAGGDGAGFWHDFNDSLDLTRIVPIPHKIHTVEDAHILHENGMVDRIAIEGLIGDSSR